MTYVIVRSAGDTVCYTNMFIPGDAGMKYERACAEADLINEAFARIAELERERDEYKEVAAANAAINRQCKERIESDAARITELEAQLAESENEKNLIFEGIGNLLQRLEKEETLRREKNARIAELETQIGVLFDTIKRGDHESRERAESDAANFEQLREGYVSAQARIAELEISLDKAQNEIIMEASERAAYQVSCAEMEKQMHVKDTYIQQQQIQIASLTEALNNSRRREMARF